MAEFGIVVPEVSSSYSDDIHGARAVLQSAKHKQDAVSSWANQLMARRNNNIASVALANKNARTVWALLAKEREYCAPIISA